MAEIDSTLQAELGYRVIEELEREQYTPFSRIRKRANAALSIAKARRMISGEALFSGVTTHNRHLNADADGVRAR